MRQGRTLREKFILTLAGSFILVYGFVVYVGHPLYQKQKRQEQNIESKILFIKKYYQTLNQADYYREKEKANQALSTQLGNVFLYSPKPALAAADLQKSLEDKARNSRVRLVQVKTEKTRYTEGLMTIPVRITVKSSLEKLSHLIRLIESDSKFLVVEELTIRRINKKEPEQLESRLLVNGFIQQRLPEKLKRT